MPRCRMMRTALLGLVCAATVSLDCSKNNRSGPPNVEQEFPWVCSKNGGRPGPEDVACHEGERFVAGACGPARCDSSQAGPSGCCPGMTCTGGGVCEVPFSRIRECDTDADCDSGRKCLLQPRAHDKTTTCGFPPVDASGGCAEGTVPFNHRCISALPCDGGCTPGLVCNIDTNACEATAPLLAQADGCDVTCADGQILVYGDPDSMLFDQCCEVSCVCETLPPLQPGAWGRFSDIAVGSEALYASAYDSTYGDLVLARHDLVSGRPTTVDYIDGFPPTGDLVADPNGPRGGTDAPGPNVGAHTALALHAGLPRIAYYDLEARRLKFAALHAATGAWQVSVIDERDRGDVGRYTSMIVDAQGRPHVTYLAHRVIENGVLVTTPMYARATVPQPGSPDDWEHIPIEPVESCVLPCGTDDVCVRTEDGPACHPRADDCADDCACDEACVVVEGAKECRVQLSDALVPPCDGHCPEKTVCVADGETSSTCLPAQEQESCVPKCDNGMACVDQNGTPACRRETPYSVIGGLPEGVGLFTSLVLDEGVPTLVYYDRVRKHLRAAVAQFNAADENIVAAGFNAFAVACDPANDLGQHASLAIEPTHGRFGVAFQGHGGTELWYYDGDTLRDANAKCIDNGVRETGLHLVGASASLAFDAQGNATIAYADQTANDLLVLYRRNDTWKSPTILLHEGAYGSFAKLAITGSIAYASNYLRSRDHLDRDTSRFVVHKIDLKTLP